jgi:hypothetical protein
MDQTVSFIGETRHYAATRAVIRHIAEAAAGQGESVDRLRIAISRIATAVRVTTAD